MIKTYSLKSGGFEALIAPDFGANIFKLSYNSSDILKPLKKESELSTDPFIIGAPLLFPANRTANGKFFFEGREYSLPVTEERSKSNLHGLLYRQKFSVLSYNDSKIELLYENKGDIYPFLFKIKVLYEIKDGKFISNYSVINTDIKNMPFTFALHSTFCDRGNFSVPIEKKQERDSFNLPLSGYYPLNEFERTFISGAQSKGNVISGFYKACGNTVFVSDVKYTVSDNFDHFVLYNGGKSSGFICIEPQCGAVNGLNLKDGFKILKPQENSEFNTKIEIMRQV